MSQTFAKAASNKDSIFVAETNIDMEAVTAPLYYEVRDITIDKDFTGKPIIILSLAALSNPISETEFLAFIDFFNHAFLSLSIFQVAHIAGGALLGSQVLPAQVAGEVLQVTSVMASAGLSFLRLRKLMKQVNAETLVPGSLVVKVQSTKKMIAALNFSDVDNKANPSFHIWKQFTILGFTAPLPPSSLGILKPHLRSLQDSH